MTRTPGITEEMIVEMLLSTEYTHKEMAARLGVHPVTVNKIRHGEKRANVRPDIPRWEKRKWGHNTRTCYNCQHGRVYFKPRKDGTPSTQRAAACGLGLPDPLVHGANFAKECNAFAPKP